MVDPVLQSPTYPHFFQPLLTGFHSHLSIPVKFFSLHIEGRYQGNTVELRSDSSEKTWKVKMEGRRLTDGWKEFAAAHDFRTDDIVSFRHEGDLVFHVTGFGSSWCEILYAQDNMRNLPMEQNLEKEAEFISDDSCFVAHVTDSNLREDRRLLPRKFVRSNGLKKGSNKIILADEGGRTWTLKLNYKESSNAFNMSVGWRSFCHENELGPGDLVMFRLESSNRRTPLLRFSTESKRVSKTKVSSSSSSLSVSPFVKLKVTPAAIKYCRLSLPQSFTQGNRMEEAGGKKITLLDKHRRKWPVNLVLHEGDKRMHLGKGIKHFLHAIDVKLYEIFTVEIGLGRPSNSSYAQVTFQNQEDLTLICIQEAYKISELISYVV